LYPHEPNYEKTFPIPRLASVEPPRHETPVVTAREPAFIPRFRSNISSRGNRPFVGRDNLLDEVLKQFADPSRECVLVLHGSPGVGKSELAREFARRQRDRYPGGTFFIDHASGALPIDLATVGKNILTLDFPPGLPLPDQCQQALLAFGSAPTLLVYDNVRSIEAVQPWVPPAGMPCHVLMTTVVDRWDSGWPSLQVDPLSPAASLQLVEELTDREIAARYGKQLAELAEGLPVQICPAAATLAYEKRRGRLDSAIVTLAREAKASFQGVFERLEPSARLLLYAAAHLNTQRIPRDELFRHLSEPTGWAEAEFHRWLDACLDLHLLEGSAELRMHQLFASFLLDSLPAADISTMLKDVRRVQGRRLVEVANELANNPANTELAAALMIFRVQPEAWLELEEGVSIEDGETIGRALYEIGRFEAAQPWYERAVEAHQEGDVHGRVDHESLGRSLHCVGYCLSSRGQYEAAQPWYERAVEAKRKGNIFGQVDRTSLMLSLRVGAECLRKIGRTEQAQAWEEEASTLGS
jgi:tetratricopeptide (TPR) repeat protein